MEHELEADFRRMPGLYRLWDLQFVICREDDFQVRYADLTEDGMPLFTVYRRANDSRSREYCNDPRS